MTTPIADASARNRFRGAADAPYEDPSLPVDERVADLLGRMTLEEKAGLMFQTIAIMGPDGVLIEDPAELFAGNATVRQLIAERAMSHFNLMGGAEPSQIAAWHNTVQEIALGTRLGIPVTLSTDPRHHFTDNPGTAAMAQGFAQFPETCGLAAIGDADLVRDFADIARREYLAVGIRLALHPQIDLATEPRWSRINGTFGENAELTGRMVAAYIEGLQGPELGTESVAAMTKHFPGGGPQKDGSDPHFADGREQVYPGGMFEYHLEPFKKALAAGTSQMMPYYGMPIETDMEEVAFGFNKGVITGLLREELGFDGIVCTDWGLISDAEIMGASYPARAWGVEHLTESERVQKVIEAGCDQFGGEACPELVVALVRAGKVSEERIDTSVKRLLREKFVLGLFDEPFVDIEAADTLVGTPEAIAAGLAAQSRSITLLKNGAEGGAPVLPLAAGTKVYVEGVDAGVAAGYGTVVATPEEADVAILRTRTPWDPAKGPFEAFFHSGSLAFGEEELGRILALCGTVPTVVDVYLERPAVLPEIAAGAAALVANYGAGDGPLLDVLFGRATPEGRLPFQLPGSMADVEGQREDVPSDSKDAVFEFGFGLSY
ncbi:glycoside hydrolase family 3 protein [Yinghuangia seranimata]|uniref:glycoside hydrolase family 3 protein n=1 Tax=Yinghuangia seranimata TaxID=408067 RepID=UPI00248CA6B1|nr:glycoside hydrolase family 3 N-terminal domain-containing protein [Yinghuangia seranimata]MDI2129971.1 glycoside hydrolase family 3 N-terminal domain-containing protein [Yinghuangia seranimata]